MKLLRLPPLLRALAVSLLLAACGGGVETGGTGATASYVEGPITGFGSVIVAGIRFDDTAARVEDADGNPRDRNELRLGMRVEIVGSTIGDDVDGGRSARASRVRIASDLLGPVTSVDNAGPFITVFGQVVRIAPATVVDGVAGGVAGLQVGDIVEVHGFPEPGLGIDRYVSTRIERRATMPTAFRVRGLARDLDAAARTLRVGSQQFDLAATGVPPDLANGQMVRLAVQTAQAGGRWPVVSIAMESRRLGDHDEAEVEGLITALTSVTRFEVNGIAVDAGGATFVDGSGGIVLGARVKVRGRAAAGVLVATSVDLRSDDDAVNEGFDLRDLISGLDLVAHTFVVRGVTVFYGTEPPPLFDNGTVGDLANGRRVRVQAVLSDDGTRVVATRIGFVNN